ncbi:MAG: TlpA family protein disulfide reductase [Bacteroidota bacterium]|nr:MAG: TlpA family protein disulfide reductase [Bacteroidota bacterium]
MRAFCFLLISLLAISLPAQEEDDPGYLVSIGQLAPDFEMQLTTGEVLRLYDMRGKIVMLQFTASWCGVCRQEMPFIENEIWQPLKTNPHFALFGIDRDEPLEKVIWFSEKTQITYPLSLDPGAAIFQLYAEKEAGVTRNVIVGADGRILYLTRLFNREEFDAMKEVIFEEVAALKGE